VRHRVEGALHLNVAVGMHRARADLEQTERLTGQWPERGLLDL
jgi:hypothetical protein